MALAKAEGISNDDILELFNQWNPGAGVPSRLKFIAAGDFSHPSWELNMARKDAGLMMSAANEGNAKLSVLPSIASVMDEWIKKGHGNDDWTIITRDSIDEK